jgi:antitoxin ParD1/3/4
MPIRNVNLGDELDRLVSDKVASGRYANASEVVRASLGALEREEKEAEPKLALLHAALEEGEQSGIAPDGVFERVRARLNHQPRR